MEKIAAILILLLSLCACRGHYGIYDCAHRDHSRTGAICFPGRLF